MDWRKVKTIELDGEIYELYIVKNVGDCRWEVGDVVCGPYNRMRIQTFYGSETGYGSRARILRMRKTYPQRKV